MHSWGETGSRGWSLRCDRIAAGGFFILLRRFHLLHVFFLSSDLQTGESSTKKAAEEGGRDLGSTYDQFFSAPAEGLKSVIRQVCVESAVAISLDTTDAFTRDSHT